MNKQRIKIVISLLLSFVIVFFLQREVFLAGTPIVRGDVPLRVAQAPRSVQQNISTLFSFISRPSSKQTGTPTPTPFGEGLPQPTRENGTQPFPVSSPTSPPNGWPQWPASTATPAPQQPTLTNSPARATATPTRPPIATSTPAQAVTKVQFAECLSSKGMKFYYTSTCAACTWQKNEFGTDAFAKVTSINCDTQTQTCYSKGIGRGPAWEKPDGSMLGGVTSLSNLATISSCQQPNQ